jgi:hypothetical protein
MTPSLIAASAALTLLGVNCSLNGQYRGAIALAALATAAAGAAYLSAKGAL